MHRILAILNSCELFYPGVHEKFGCFVNILNMKNYIKATHGFIQQYCTKYVDIGFGFKFGKVYLFKESDDNLFDHSL